MFLNSLIDPSTSILQTILPNLAKQSIALSLIDCIPSTSSQQKMPSFKAIHKQDKQISENTEIHFQALNYEEAFYRPSIIRSMLDSEIETPPEEMEDPYERNQLIQKILQIKTKHKLKDNIVHLASALIDRYLITCSMLKQEYIKLGITCMWMSNKVLHKKPWTVSKWLGCTSGLIKEQLIETECLVLSKIGYEILTPLTIDFFEMFSTYFEMHPKCLRFGLNIIQFTLADCEFRRFKESEIALACLELCSKNRNKIGLQKDLNYQDLQEKNIFQNPDSDPDRQIIEIIYSAFSIKKQNILNCTKMIQEALQVTKRNLYQKN